MNEHCQSVILNLLTFAWVQIHVNELQLATQMAMRKLQDGQVAAHSHPRWHEAFVREMDTVEALQEKYERDRQVVFFEPIARSGSKLPEEKRLVTALPYQPEKILVQPF